MSIKTEEKTTYFQLSLQTGGISVIMNTVECERDNIIMQEEVF